jgi:hypothetical protein
VTMINAHAAVSTSKQSVFTMKAVQVIRIRILVILAGFAALAAPGSYAQSEIDPDHFESPNTEPFPQPKTKAVIGAEIGRVLFRGEFTLPYSLQCAGKRLLAGNYSLALRSDGKIGWVTLNQKGRTTEIAGVVRLPADSRARNALFVERSGNTRRLSAIHVAELGLVLDVDQERKRDSGGKPRRIEKLPLLLSGPQK